MAAWIYGFSILLMILLPVLLAVGLRRIAQPPWILFGIGCLTFNLSQVIHLPLNNWLSTIGLLPATAASGRPLWQTASIVGLTAGLCEELMRTAGFAAIRRLKPGWMRLQDAVMLGLGHGGIESMVFGGVLTAASIGALLPLIGVDLNTLGLKPDQVDALRRQLETVVGNPWIGALPLLERVIALTAHGVFSLMVWKAFSGRGGLRWVYIPLAILYHAAVDFFAVYGLQYLKDQPLLMEMIFAAIMIPGYVWVFWQIRRHGKTEAPPTGIPNSPVRSELGIFWTATQKEIIQLWKTRRLLVMGAVFLFFGMGSPLFAKLTPEILRSVQGGEIFANLIPTPSAADAMGQYLKNLYQFGFLLAILLVMGAVVGEKETRVAPMILSKPMPRWAFITSKFAAHCLMYLGGFILAGIGAYYYTWILFGPLEPGAFILMNALLLLWVLTFVALGLLGSVLGKSTVAAGGIGVGLSVALILAGSIPRYGPLLPGGLLEWAGQAGQTAAGVQPALANLSTTSIVQMPINSGASASAIVLILVVLILSIGCFEQQEL
jgi:ABC-2 type transport system permease protein